MTYRSGCLVCGEELVYLEGDRPVVCASCGTPGTANVTCRSGHYICDACHSLGANDWIEQACAQSASTDPIELAISIMRHPSINMHGPEHHFLVPAVLAAAYYNQKGEPEQKLRRLRQARERAEYVKGGMCGFYGACGAAIGTGIFVSLVTGAKPVSKEEWQLSNRMTACSLGVIAENGGPRCCKRDTFLALQQAVEYSGTHLGVPMSSHGAVVCEFYPMNRECRGLQCPFHPR